VSDFKITGALIITRAEAVRFLNMTELGVQRNRKEQNVNAVFAKKVALSFGRAFLGAFVVLAPGIWLAPDLNTGKAAAVAALMAGVAAGLRAVQVLFTTWESPTV
jgi:hypothetical protein